ncbi:MAG: transcription termination/antitermination protein NusA, partial [Pseudomonadota bacterium]
MAVAREPGVRAKIAVASSDSDIDAVGACVGMKGSRVQNVVHELRGEKIDIVPWHADSAKFVCNALAPAQISRVIIDEANHSMEVIVPDEFLSVAIGKKGQNVRLASKLSGWRLDVKDEKAYNRAMQEGYASLLALPGMAVSVADALYEKGFFSIEELAQADPEDLEFLQSMQDLDPEAIIRSAAEAMEAMEAGEDAAQEAAPATPAEEDSGEAVEEESAGEGETEEAEEAEESPEDAEAEAEESPEDAEAETEEDADAEAATGEGSGEDAPGEEETETP